MATLINNAGVQHYANKMVLAENRKVGSKSLPTALSDIDNLIDEMKTHFDAEYGSSLDMKLENNENVFSVGTGTDVDKRSEVENSFTDVELSGNSLVNLFTTTQNFASFGYGIVRNGFVITLSNTSGWSKTGNRLNLKPNTTYYAQITCENKSDNACSSYIRLSHDLNHSTSADMPSFPANSTTTRNIVFTTDDTGLVLLSVERGEGTNESIFYDIILLEGDWTNKPIPQYFEGMKSVGEKEDGNHKVGITSVRKNLFDKSNGIKIGQALGQHDGLYDDSTMFSSEAIKVKPNTTYRLTEVYWGWYCDGNKKKLSNFSVNHMGGTITTPLNCHYIRISGKINTLDLVQIEYNNQTINYESFRIDKKEISLNEPLRGLPNGVKDTVEKVNGEWKIVRRCSEVVLNGSEPWELLSDTDKEKTIGFRILNFLPLSRYGDRYKMVVCDRFPSYKHNLWKKDYEGITTENNIQDIINKTQLQIIISKSKLSTKNIAGFKQWLSQNPTKVIYQLDTPIIEDISPITLQCWKNGTISIDEVLPVETTHTVALNKPAQIKRNIEELTALRKRVQALEDFYDQVALEQAHQLSLLNHSIELDYDI